MSEKRQDKSFWLELEAASKGLSIAGGRDQAEHLKQLFEELKEEEPSSEPYQISFPA
jgi:hypothetical protein